MRAAAEEAPSYSAEEWYEFRALMVSLFLIYQTNFIHLGLNVGNREEAENYLRIARGIVDASPAFRRFWDEEIPTGTFIRAFVDAVNEVENGSSLRHMLEPKAL